MDFTLTFWTNNVDYARWADLAGVDRIGLDLESVGKANRQAGLATWLSDHKAEDIISIRGALSRAKLFVRTDPLNVESCRQVDALLEAGVDIIMLPNFTHSNEVSSFCKIVGGRAKVVPLVERLEAIKCIEMFADLGISEFHVGLNDLSIDLGIENRLAVLAAPIMKQLSMRAIEKGLRFGVGGVGRVDDPSLPVHSDLIYAQHARLKSTGALLARSFLYPEMNEYGFVDEVSKIRQRLNIFYQKSELFLEKARMELMRITN